MARKKKVGRPKKVKKHYAKCVKRRTRGKVVYAMASNTRGGSGLVKNRPSYRKAMGVKKKKKKLTMTSGKKKKGLTFI